MAFQYAWYQKGRTIAIVTKNVSTIYDKLEAKGVIEYYGNPSADDTDAILLEFTCYPSIPTAETDTIDVSNLLNLAILEYVRYRLNEEKFRDTGDLKYDAMAQRCYGRFRVKLAEHDDNLNPGIKKMMPSGPGALL